MSFFVDIVTEDSFYENMTLGVVRALENIPCVKNVRIDRRNGCERNTITCWEQRHCCSLPEDMKNFYTSIDGFSLEWNLEIAGEEFAVGRMHVNPLSSLKRHVNPNNEKSIVLKSASEELEGGEEAAATAPEEAQSAETPSTIPSFNSRNCKLFEISRCYPQSDSRVYLVYQNLPEHSEPAIWLHGEEINKWYRLADSFAKYFRMMLVHLGLPLWQVSAAAYPLPTWVEQVYYLVAPHLLPSAAVPTSSISTTLWDEGPTNVLDPNIFKNKDNKNKAIRKK